MAKNKKKSNKPEAHEQKHLGIRFETFVDRNNEARWRMVDGNHRIVGVSGEGFTRSRDAVRAVENILDDLHTQFITGQPVTVLKAKAVK